MAQGVVFKPPRAQLVHVGAGCRAANHLEAGVGQRAQLRAEKQRKAYIRRSDMTYSYSTHATSLTPSLPDPFVVTVQGGQPQA